MAGGVSRGGSIKRRLIVLILACSTAVTVLISAWSLLLDYRADLAEIERRLGQIEASYTQSVSQSVWQMDPDALQLQLDGIKRLPDIVDARVRESDAQDETSPPLQGPVIVREMPLRYVQGEESFELGNLVVTAGLDAVYARMWRKLWLILTTQFAETLVVVGAIFAIVERLITRHLVAVAKHVRSMDLENHGTALLLERARREDELSQVETAINWLSDTVRAKIDDLDRSRREVDELNRSLERKVEARTSELAEAVDVLQTSERRFRDVAAVSGDWIWELDGQGRFTYSSPVVERVLGYGPEEISGRALSDFLSCEGSEERQRELCDAIAAGKALQEFEVVGRGKQGQRVIGELWMVPVGDVDGGPSSGFRGVLRDVTERRRAEEELETAHRKLVDASRLAGKAEIATGVLHNMGNVLNGVTVSLSLLREKLQSSKSRDLERVVAVAQQRAGDFATFVGQDPKGKQLLPVLVQLSTKLSTEHAFVSSEVEQLVAKLGHIHEVLRAQQQFAGRSQATQASQPTELVEEALRLTGDAFASKQIRVEREFAQAGDTPVLVDRHKVLQILTNLLLNAKDAVSECGYEPQQGVVTVSAVGDADGVWIGVRDNGVGIAEEDLVRVFRYGFTTKKEGHGFGLHSSANTAGELGGELRVLSKGKGHGAEFRLRLPREPKHARAAEADAETGGAGATAAL